MSLKATVVFHAIDDEEGCLLDVETRSLFSLNATGMLVAQCLQAGSTRRALAEAIKERFEIDDVGLRADLDEFLLELGEAGLLG